MSAFGRGFLYKREDGYSTVITPGDRVVIKTPHGNELSGRVVFAFPTHVTINIGGRHGTPRIADNSNIVSVRRRRI